MNSLISLQQNGLIYIPQHSNKHLFIPLTSYGLLIIFRSLWLGKSIQYFRSIFCLINKKDNLILNLLLFIFKFYTDSSRTSGKTDIEYLKTIIHKTRNIEREVKLQWHFRFCDFILLRRKTRKKTTNGLLIIFRWLGPENSVYCFQLLQIQNIRKAPLNEN